MGAVCATYMVGRDLFSSRWAGLASAASLLSFLGFIEYATNGPREKTPMVLFVLLAMWMLTRQFGVGGIVRFSPATVDLVAPGNRTISVDIRYVLFVTEKFGGAKWIVDEMNVVGGGKAKAASH